ncbi:EF-P 5-aminopentanol modification-associated protein YfmH [Scatolibacter rhodanostii]|uniref:EF-P 5-aminopentanol modification-associated protein YfmH n=1 Tax=Scatolibacter rhodanostii TaxID=2014781 RepID=UPI000C06D2B4|nr:pitrilysin family protein [Scatolibacter rhodanostii]
MEKKKVTGQYINDSYYQIKHPSGLEILIYPKENSTTTYALFGTRYGSIDNCFKRSDELSAETVPEGIAHYLEHKLFESEEGDAFERYAKTGASANAFTSFDSTCYLFSCTDRFYESLEILLDFVQSPYFTKETVAKEQGIIGQEIKMYDDDPNWRVVVNHLRALYHHHPVKDDIAGTVESIAEITPEYLYRCYHTFYNLNNMALCITGDVDIDGVLDICDKMLKKAEPIKIERVFPAEPQSVVTHYVEDRLSVAIPVFQFGFKEILRDQGHISEKDLAAVEVLLEILASDSSPLFRKLLDAGLVSESSFSHEYFEGAGYASVFFSGESKDPKRVSEIIMDEVHHLQETGIDEKSFQRAKKACYGEIVSALNSTSAISNIMVSLAFKDRELFAYVDAFPNLLKEDVEQKLKQIFVPEQSALSVILPLENNEKEFMA